MKMFFSLNYATEGFFVITQMCWFQGPRLCSNQGWEGGREAWCWSALRGLLDPVMGLYWWRLWSIVLSSLFRAHVLEILVEHHVSYNYINWTVAEGSLNGNIS